MRMLRQLLQKEGWYLSETGLPIQVGVKFATSPFGKKHLHQTMAEYFLIIAGTMKLSVAGQVLEMEKGDLLLVEPGETHEVLSCSADALLLLLMPPPLAGDKVEL
ncbi:MAG TPA: cupin domain-containing protein [Patescibacteria group bacterium]|nr:cupin domain-containing protein [Patescibacteria group bacterium]